MLLLIDFRWINRVYRWGRLHLRYSERGMGRTGGSES
jgi:hypothetical protein